MRIFFLIFFFLSAGVSAQININNYLFRSKQAIVEARYTEAIELLNPVISVRPEMHEPFFLRAISKYNLGDFKGAERDFTAAINIKPNFPDALMYRGICRERMLNFSDALHDFERALKIDPFNDDVLVAKAFTKTIQEDYTTAIELCNEAISINHKNERALLCRAWCRYKTYDLQGAVDDYSRAIKINPFNADSFTKRGMVHAFQLKYNESLEDLNRALEMDSLNLHTLYQLAFVHNELKEHDKALELFSKMIRIDPETAVAYYERGQLLADMDETNAAIDDYTMVIVLTGGHLLTYFNRGSLYYKTGKYSAAVEDLTKAIELYPGLAEAYYNRALAYSRLGMQSQAAADVDRAKVIKSELYTMDASEQQREMKKIQDIAQLKEDFQGTDVSLGRIQNQRINIRPAPDFFIIAENWIPDSLKNESVFIKSIVNLTHSDQGWQLLSHHGWRPDNANEKREQLNQQLAENPDDLSLLLRQGILFQLMENYDLSLEVYEAVLQQEPQNPVALLNRAYVLNKMLVLYETFDQPAGGGSHPPLTNQAIQSNFDKIAADLKSLLSAHPQFVPARFNLANLNTAIGKHSEAVQQFDAIIAAEPELSPAHFNMGLSLLYLNNKEEACEHLSTSGELGYLQAYPVIKRFCQP